MKKNILLSVIIISYKQKQYIKEAIDSVLMQKTDFKYELILSDDCSKDGTLEIMYDYQKKYPDIVKVIDRKTNLGATNNQLDAANMAKGKYITFLEGDDYWCDENKINEQVHFLEQNEDFIAHTHVQEGRNLKNEVQGYFPTNKEKEDFIIDGVNDLLDDRKISEMATVYRNIYLDKKKYEDLKHLFSFDSIVSDSQICSYLASLGKIYVSKKPMMVYRMRNSGDDSNYNSTHKLNEIKFTYMTVNSKLDEFFNYKYNYSRKIRDSFVIGVTYDLIHFNFKDIKKFNKGCPKKYKAKFILLYPFYLLRLIIKRIKNKRV